MVKCSSFQSEFIILKLHFIGELENALDNNYNYNLLLNMFQPLLFTFY